jgi:DNA-binding transcriptional ArsR family regulator/outer membrane protein assembly factor BamB
LKTTRGEKGDDSDTYSIIFKALKHPIRRRILSLLADKPLTFSELLRFLGVDSGHLSYHLEALGHLVSKTEDGCYRLSAFGAAAVGLFTGVEGTVPRKQGILTGRVLDSIQSITKRRPLGGTLILGLLLLAGLSANYYFTTPTLQDAHTTWSIPLGNGAILADMTVDGQYLAIAKTSVEGRNSTLYEFNHMGNEYWRHSLNDILLNLVISPFGSFIAAYGHSLYLFDINGHLLWHGRIPSLDRLAVTEYGNIIASRNDSVIYFSPHGQLQWNSSLTSATLLKPMEASTQFVVTGNMFQGQDLLTVFNQDGTYQWARLMDGPIKALYADVSLGRIVVGTSASEVYLVDSQGQLMWRTEVPAPIASVSSILDDNLVLVAAQNGIAYTYDMNGRLVGENRLGYGAIDDVLLSFNPDVAVVSRTPQASWLHFLEIEHVVTIPAITNELVGGIIVAVVAALIVTTAWVRKRRSIIGAE